MAENSDITATRPESVPAPLSSNKKPLFTATLLGLAALLAGTGVVDMLLSALGGTLARETAANYLADVRHRATAAFLAARALSVLVSMIQSAELSLLVAHVKPGMALAPVGGLLDVFSNVMLAGIVTVGLQELLLTLGWKIGFSIFLPPAFLLLALARIPVRESVQIFGRRLGRFFLATAIIVKILFPLIGLSGATITSGITETRYSASMESLKTAREKLARQVAVPSEANDSANKEVAPPAARTPRPEALDEAAEKGWMARMARRTGLSDMAERAGEIMEETRAQFRMPDVETLRAVFADLADTLTVLGQVLILETFLLPLLSAIFFLLALKTLMRASRRLQRSQ